MKKLIVLFTMLIGLSLAVTDDNKVLATVAGEPITVKDLQYKIELFPPQQQAMLNTEDGRKMMLEEIAKERVFYQEAKQKNVDRDPDIAKRLEIIKAQLVISKYLTDLLSKASLSEEQQKKYFEENKSQFIKDEVWASHILVNDEKKAQAIYENLKAGANFGEVAKKDSICPSSKNEGDLGWFGRGRMVKEFEDQAYALKKGAISKPFKTEFGWHIVKQMDRSAAVKYEDVAVEVRNKALENERAKILENKYAELQKLYPVKFEN